MNEPAPATGRIHVRDLRIDCVIGAFPHERLKTQPVVLNLTLHVDPRRPAASDALADAVDYKALTDALIERIESSKPILLERLTWEAADVCFEFDGVQAVRVTAEKPEALQAARSVAVEVFRRR